MNWFVFTLELYFAFMFSISGIAKLSNYRSFVMILWQQHMYPRWSLSSIGRILPWIEIVLALLLVLGIGKLVIASGMLTLLALFLVGKIFLLARGRAVDCGCYGSVKPQKIDGVSIAVSGILVLLATVHLWLVIHVPPISWQWRLGVGLLLIIVECFLLVRIFIKYRNSSFPLTTHDPTVGGLEIGEQATLFTSFDIEGNRVSLEAFRGKWVVLLLVLPGCFVCPLALEALNDVVKDKPDVIGLVVGIANAKRNRAYALEQKVQTPFLTPVSGFVEQVYSVRAFPLAFIIDDGGVVRAKGIVNDYLFLRDLLRHASVSVMTLR